ncbi:hypothetical protein Fcan01_19272 [Folsomia candida]|uniref:Uncharacterized protein n=1 Tax=Folsomia candida TaxID=158441 RepID=A0A226DL81_FOLCA|nr:hypothetical protein Fcan01_19272 [Folsomia candida]
MFSMLEFALPVKIGGFWNSSIIDDKASDELGNQSEGYDLAMPELHSNKKYSSGLYGLGFVILGVAQIEGPGYHQEEGLATLHPNIKVLRHLITALTKNDVANRLQSMDEVNQLIANWEFRDESIFPKFMTARNMMELHRCLEDASSGSIITLGEGVYFGGFVVAGENITINGKGPLTIIENNNDSPGLIVEGKGHAISNISIYQKGMGSSHPCLKVLGDENYFSGLTLLGGIYGFAVSGKHNKFDNLNISDCIHRMVMDGPGMVVDRIRITSARQILCD